MTAFQRFEMERMMSKWENVVEFNLSESGVHPLSLGELLELAGTPAAELLRVRIGYPQANGLVELRAAIAALYPGATAADVLVTVGAAEANYLAVTTLVDPGDEIVLVLPNYMQIYGVAKNRGAKIRVVQLVEERGWALDLEALNAAVGSRTKLVAVCNPNNPTGRIFTAAEMAGVVAAAERVGAWLLADEVYRGAERETDAETPSFYGRYDKVLAQGSLSKAYGLPGLRIGWSVGPADVIDQMWARHEYTTISTAMLANRLALLALSPGVRPQILARTRRCIRAGYPQLEAWAVEHTGTVELFPPQAAAIAFLRYHLEVGSTGLVERLRDERSVLIVPGDHFGLDRHLRISFGLPEEYLAEGLRRIHDTLVELGA